MKTDLFECKEYRTYLLAVLGDKSERKGMKSAAAKSIGCHTTFISQVLSGKVQW